MREGDGLNDALDQEDGILEAQARKRRAQIDEDDYYNADEDIGETAKSKQNVENRLKRYKTGADVDDELAAEDAELEEAELAEVEADEAALAADEAALAAEETALAAEAAEGLGLAAALEEFWWLIFFL